MRKLTSLGLYFISFIVGRGSLLVAPLILSNLLLKADYGRVEWAQASAALVSNWITVGTAAALPLVMIVGETEATQLGIYSHNLLVGGLGFLGAGLMWAAGTRPEWRLAALFTATLTLQNLWSIRLKTEGRAESSIFLQAGLFTLLALCAVILVYVLKVNPASGIWTATLIYSVILTFFTARFIRQRLKAGEAIRYWSALKIGAPLMISTAFTVMATTSDRFCIGLVASPLVTAEYAVLARGAAVPIVAHQLITIIRFRDLFAISEEKLDPLIAKILALVASAAVVFIMLYPWIGYLLGHAFVDAFNRHRAAALYILGSEILWSGIALNDLVFTRHQIMKRVLPWTGSCLLLAYPIGYLLLRKWGITLPHFAILYVGLMTTYYLCQCGVMFRNGIRHYRSLAVAVGSVSAFLVFAWFQS